LTLEIEDLVENTLSRKISKLSVTDLREKIINIKRVKNAVVKFSINGYIQVEVIERRGLAVYSEGKSYMVLDEEGIRISHYNEWRKVPNLPLVVGKGADGKLSDFIFMQGNLQSLVSEIEFYEWVGERRWNLHFKNKLIVKLPESNLGEGLNFLFALRERKFLNNYEVIMIDLRNLDKPFIKFRDDLTREKYSEVL